MVIGHEEQKKDADGEGEEAGGQEDDFPGGNAGAVVVDAFGDAVGQEATEDLRPAVEGEPDADAGPLLGFRVPLRGEEGEARRDGCFEDAQEEADGQGALEVAGCRHAAEDQAPHHDAEGGVFGEREALQQAVCWVFPCQIAKIKHTTEPVIVVACEFKILFETHDASV